MRVDAHGAVGQLDGVGLAHENGALIPESGHQPRVGLPFRRKSTGGPGEGRQPFDPVQILHGDGNAAEGWWVRLRGESLVRSTRHLPCTLGVELLVRVIARVGRLVPPYGLFRQLA